MKASALALFALGASALFAEQQPFERYQPIIDRQMFGQPPPNFDPTKPSSEAPKGNARGEEELTREQAVIKSSIHFSAINVTPEGATAVGFTDNSNPKMPVHYYLKVGEERNGWKVTEADPVKATMTIVKDDVEVSLELGANSGGGKGGAAAGNAATRDVAGRGMAAGQRAGLLGGRRGGFGGAAARNADAAGAPVDATKLGSLRERRAALAQERAAEEAKERAKREAEREEQRKELQLLKDELKAQRDAAEKERAEREAERAAREQERAARMNEQQVEGNAED